jgi:hypothetical protein
MSGLPGSNAAPAFDHASRATRRRHRHAPERTRVVQIVHAIIFDKRRRRIESRDLAKLGH